MERKNVWVSYYRCNWKIKLEHFYPPPQKSSFLLKKKMFMGGNPSWLYIYYIWTFQILSFSGQLIHLLIVVSVHFMGQFLWYVVEIRSCVTPYHWMKWTKCLHVRSSREGIFFSTTALTGMFLAIKEVR